MIWGGYRRGGVEVEMEVTSVGGGVVREV